MNDPYSRARQKDSIRISVLAAGLLALGFWWLAISRGSPDRILFSLWVVALILCGAALYRPWPVARPDLLTAVIGAGLVAAILPRVLGAGTNPYEVTLDEALHPLLGQRVLATDPWRIFDGVSDHFATPYFDLVSQAFLPGLWGARLMSAIWSTVSLAATYALAKRLYDRETAVFAAIVLACSYWHIAYARTGYPFMQPMAVVPLALWVLVAGLEEEHGFLLFCGGVLLGLSTLVYTPGRIAVPIFAAWWGIGALRGRFRWRSSLPVVLGFTVFLTPYLYRQSVFTFVSRFVGVTSPDTTPLGAAGAQGWPSSAAWETLVRQTQSAVGAYFSGGAWMAPHSVAPGPLLDRATLMLALAGLLLSLVLFRRPASLLLLIWVLAVFAGGQVLTDVAQSAYRAAPLLPAVAIAAGRAVAWPANALGRRAPRWRNILYAAVGFALVACIAPPNVLLLDGFFEARTDDAGAAMARVVGDGDSRMIYYIVDVEPHTTDPRFQILASGKNARDVASLNDLLGARLADQVDIRFPGAVIVLGPSLRTAEQAVRRCYPGAIPLAIPQWRGVHAPVALLLRRQAIASGRACTLSIDDERGLRAAYYRDDSFEGEIVRSGLEDWPARWMPAEGGNFGSVEWRGYLNVPIAGTYKLQLMSTSKGSTAAIGKTILLEAGDVQTVPLMARAYAVTLRFRAAPYADYALVWGPPGGDGEVIPPALFSPYPRNRSDRRWIEQR